MNIDVKLFAAARQYCGCDQVSIDLEGDATVGELRAALAEAHPSLQAILPSSMIALNHDYADDETPIPEDAEIALIPPVSGG